MSVGKALTPKTTLDPLPSWKSARGSQGRSIPSAAGSNKLEGK